MPSIPQSLLWISLVVLWLFVLVPMLISKRDAVRRTSDVALATRVLNGRNAQRLRRGPAAGHNSDPNWRPTDDHLDEKFDDLRRDEQPERSVVVVAAAAEVTEPDYLDVDIVEEDSGALPVGTTLTDAEPATDRLIVNAEELVEEMVEKVFAEPVTEPVAEGAEQPVAEAAVEPEVQENDGTADEYEYVDDSSGLEAESESGNETEPEEDGSETRVASLSASRQRRLESTTAEAVSARKFQFRKRVISVFAVVLVMSAAAAFLLTPSAWWVFGIAATLTMLYLAYLRRQTRIEEQLRHRRAQRMKRSRLGVDSTDDHRLDVVPARLRRPGSVVLDIDDEDPIFEHLDNVPFDSEYDLPRAAGQ